MLRTQLPLMLAASQRLLKSKIHSLSTVQQIKGELLSEIVFSQWIDKVLEYVKLIISAKVYIDE